MRTVAVILAGGVGERVGLDIPKQLIKVAGKPVLEHTIAAFDANALVDEIIVMMAPGHLDAVRQMVPNDRYAKVTKILEGGSSRNDTTQRALDALGPQECKVLLHDAVRPLVSPRIIDSCVRALDSWDAVDTAIPSADTVIQIQPDTNVIQDVLPRALIRRGQTPQAFRASIIRQAYAYARADPNFAATDDCTVVLRYLPDVPIAVIPGDDQNMKITEPIDVYLADKLFQLNSRNTPEPRSPEDHHHALRGKTLVVFGGSYGIGRDIADLAESFGATVCEFSRSTTRTHVERREDLAEAYRAVLAKTGRVDFVVNTAGVLPTGPLADTSDEELYRSTEINYLAPMLIAQIFYPALRESQGSLLLFTSSSYTRGRGGYSLYSSAKAATVNLTQALADEWAGDGVRVNCMNPERTRTPMRVHAFGDEPADSLLPSRSVAMASLDALTSTLTGQVVDVSRSDPLGSCSYANEPTSHNGRRGQEVADSSDPPTVSAEH